MGGFPEHHHTCLWCGVAARRGRFCYACRSMEILIWRRRRILAYHQLLQIYSVPAGRYGLLRRRLALICRALICSTALVCQVQPGPMRRERLLPSRRRGSASYTPAAPS